MNTYTNIRNRKYKKINISKNIYQNIIQKNPHYSCV